MLRGDLHFNGVVISDDLGTSALSQFSLATRAIDYFAAGGSILLDTTLQQIPVMVNAVTARAAAKPAFAATLEAAEMHVLLVKATAHLIS
jgi:beta-N-acetylhexosaminidase